MTLPPDPLPASITPPLPPAAYGAPTAAGPGDSAPPVAAPPATWVFRGSLLVVLIAALLPWFAIAPFANLRSQAKGLPMASLMEAPGKELDIVVHVGCSTGIVVMVVLGVLAAGAASLLSSQLPRAGVIVVGSTAFALLFVVLGLSAGKPGGSGSVMPFGELLQPQIAWAGWLALIAAIAAMVLAIMVHRTDLRSLMQNRPVPPGPVG